MPYLTLCLPLGLHLLMGNPPHPGSLCFTASLCPPSPWLSSPVLAQGFVLTSWDLHALPPSLLSPVSRHTLSGLPSPTPSLTYPLAHPCPPTVPLADTANGETLSQLTLLSLSPVHSLSSWYSLKPKLISDLNKVTSFPMPDHPT